MQQDTIDILTPPRLQEPLSDGAVGKGHMLMELRVGGARAEGAEGVGVGVNVVQARAVRTLAS
jgi:hypothetical protein